MTTVLYYLSILATLAVAVVLFLGLRSMLKGGSPSRSQQLMRWRIGLQFIAIVLMVVFAYLTRGFA